MIEMSTEKSYAIKRQSGILLPIYSLPGPEGIGTLGDYELFINALQTTTQCLWQVLPIHPTSYGDSPFQGPSLFAGNPALISLKDLTKVGDLEIDQYECFLRSWNDSISENPGRSDEFVEYSFIWEKKLGYDKRKIGFDQTPLRQSFEGLKKNKGKRFEEFMEYADINAEWLYPYSCFMHNKNQYGFEVPWNQWNIKDKTRNLGFDDNYDLDEIEFHSYLQFVFDDQMTEMSRFLNQKKITFVGDTPIYPAYDSADVWSNLDIYQLDDAMNMTHVSGVPPDLFSKTGQYWGNPVYKWGIVGNSKDHEKVYKFWADRIKTESKIFDITKIDHFRAFSGYGRIVPNRVQDATTCKWTRGPGIDIFNYLTSALGQRPELLAEDLGVITPSVKNLLKMTGYPGIKLLQFSDFNDSKCDHLPENMTSNQFYYTGTHDNEIMMQFLFENNRKNDQMIDYLNSNSDQELMHMKSIDVVSKSLANWAVFPMQDVLGLGGNARMNFPSKKSGYWKWRLTQKNLEKYVQDDGMLLNDMTFRYKRV